MAHWVVGAHALAADELATARAELARSGDDRLSRGYLGVVDLMERGDRSQLDDGWLVATATATGGDDR